MTHSMGGQSDHLHICSNEVKHIFKYDKVKGQVASDQR